MSSTQTSYTLGAGFHKDLLHFDIDNLFNSYVINKNICPYLFVPEQEAVKMLDDVNIVVDLENKLYFQKKDEGIFTQVVKNYLNNYKKLKEENKNKQAIDLKAKYWGIIEKIWDSFCDLSNSKCPSFLEIKRIVAHSSRLSIMESLIEFTKSYNITNLSFYFMSDNKEDFTDEFYLRSNLISTETNDLIEFSNSFGAMIEKDMKKFFVNTGFNVSFIDVQDVFKITNRKYIRNCTKNYDVVNGKKYKNLKYTSNRGIVLARRDISSFIHNAYSRLIKIILENGPKEKCVEYIESEIMRLRNNNLVIDDIMSSKTDLKTGLITYFIKEINPVTQEKNNKIIDTYHSGSNICFYNIDKEFYILQLKKYTSELLDISYPQ